MFNYLPINQKIKYCRVELNFQNSLKHHNSIVNIKVEPSSTEEKLNELWHPVAYSKKI